MSGVNAVYAAHPDSGTTAHLVDTCDLGKVEKALQTLLRHHVLGIDWKSGTGKCAGYQPIKLLIISCGDDTFIFDVMTPGKLPASLRLLLTHQDYAKILYGGQDLEQTLGRFWRDFGFMPKATYDVMADIADKYDTGFTLFRAFRKEYRNPKVSEAFYVESLSPEADDLDQPSKRRLFAFVAWAGRDIFLSIAKPKGLPPRMQVKHEPVDVAALASRLSCNPVVEMHAQCKACSSWFLDDDALEMHQETTHPKCSYCGAQFHSISALQKHRYGRVNGICIKVKGPRPRSAPRVVKCDAKSFHVHNDIDHPHERAAYESSHSRHGGGHGEVVGTTPPVKHNLSHNHTRHHHHHVTFPGNHHETGEKAKLSSSHHHHHHHHHGHHGHDDHDHQAHEAHQAHHGHTHHHHGHGHSHDHTHNDTDHPSERAAYEGGGFDLQYDVHYDSAQGWTPPWAAHVHDVPGPSPSDHHQNAPGSVRFVPPPKTPDGPLNISREAEHVGEIPN